MISFDIGNHNFQVRAAAVFICQNSVLLHRLEGDRYWALPGGRVESGEEATSAIAREMREELGQDVVCGPLTYVVENFFDHGEKQTHEIGFYFHTSFRPGSPLLDMTQRHFGVEGNRKLEFKWFEIAILNTVDLRPSFLRQSLLVPLPHFKHFVQR